MKAKGTYFTLADRQIIEKGISNSFTKSAIVQTLGEIKSIIGKEIKICRILKHKYPLFLEITNYKKCKYDWSCYVSCPRNHSSSACNVMFVDSRKGVNMIFQEAKNLCNIIKPHNRQSPELNIYKKNFIILL